MGVRIFLLLVFLIILPLANSLPNNLGFEDGNLSSWTSSYSDGSYAAAIAQNWASEGNYSVVLGGGSGMFFFSSHYSSITHSSLQAQQNDQVCIDIKMDTPQFSSWKLYSGLSSTSFKDPLSAGEYNNTCITAQQNGSLDFTVKGTATGGCGNPDNCRARIYIDNINIYSCTNGIKDSDESDIDCGGRCSPCSNGMNCSQNADCASFYCLNSTCREAPSYSYFYNLNFEQGLNTYWGFGGGQSGASISSKVSPQWSSDGTYGLWLSRNDGGLLNGQGNSATATHNTTQLVSGDKVCLDMQKNSTSGGQWRVKLSTGGDFISPVPNAIYEDLCVASQNNGSLGIVVEGTEGFSPCASPECLGLFFFDNLTINAANCTNGVLNRVETDVDCGSFCSKCLAGRSCSFNFDCASGNCSSTICTAPPSCSNLALDIGEEGIDCGSACNITCERALLERYAPVLYFHPDEQFFPTSIEAMLNESRLMNSTSGFDDVLDDLPVDQSSLIITQNTSYLDLENASATTSVFGVPSSERFKKYVYQVYARQFSVNENLTVLQYWFFYVFKNALIASATAAAEAPVGAVKSE